jgi:predicted ATPase
LKNRIQGSLSSISYYVSLQKHKGLSDPLEVVAGEISDDAVLLCLDEFMVNFKYDIYFFLP